MSRDMKTECSACRHKRPVPGDAHIQCVKPMLGMTGDPHGIKQGWFFYPLLFDPVWKTTLCTNFEEEAKDSAQSQPEQIHPLDTIAALLLVLR
jgi:hypothetical protein